MQTQERPICNSGRRAPLPVPSLSFFVQFPGLLWGLYNYLSCLLREAGGKTGSRIRGEERKAQLWLLENVFRTQLSWLGVCEVLALIPTNSSTYSLSVHNKYYLCCRIVTE